MHTLSGASADRTTEADSGEKRSRDRRSYARNGWEVRATLEATLDRNWRVSDIDPSCGGFDPKNQRYPGTSLLLQNGLKAAQTPNGPKRGATEPRDSQTAKQMIVSIWLSEARHKFRPSGGGEATIDKRGDGKLTNKPW